MTASRMTEIQARLDAATKGPWESIPIDGTPNWIFGRAASPDGGYYGTEDVLRIADENLEGSYLSDDDADLIANAPADLAYLLSELRAAQERIDKALAASTNPGNGLIEHERILLERVRAALTDEGNN